MTVMPLTLYRRHVRDCAKNYPQNQRLFYPATKAQRSADCQCPINAEGKLGEDFLTNKSLRTGEWDEALDIANQWEEWGQTMAPTDTDDENRTVVYAVESFLQSVGPNGRNIDESSLSQYKVLLEQRILPYCESKGYRLIREFDSLDVTTKFVESWRNLNPTKNRKNVPVPKDGVPLADSTKKSQVELLRIVFAYCVERGWLEHNRAKQIKIKTKTAAKFGMEPWEEEWFFEEIAKFTDGHYRTGQQNAIELRTFCMTMRQVGLRISDAVALDDTAIVPRASEEGWAIQVFQNKTEEWVYIPITASLEAALRKLPIKGEVKGKRYWFWTGVGAQKSAKNNFYMRIMKIVRRVEEEHGPFAHPVTPHTFRHTFSIRHLNAGTDLKIVSRWLGHQSVSVTEAHYAHAVHGTKLHSEEAYDESMRRQEEQVAKLKRRHIAVVNSRN
jgi:site-specific recombinase XerD